MFGFQRRLVRRWECDTDMPHEGFLPHTSHTEAMAHHHSTRSRSSAMVDEATATGDERGYRSQAPNSDRTRLATGPSSGPLVHGRRPYSVAVPTLERPLERFSVRRPARHRHDVPRHVRAHQDAHQPAQRLPGARRRHRHQHGPHARRGGRRDGGGARRADADVRRHQPRLADGRPRQQRRDPLARSCAGIAVDAARAAPRPTAATVAEALQAASDGRLPGRAQADRGHHPHRGPGERPTAPRGGRRRRRLAGRRAARGPGRRARRRSTARPSCCRC